MQSDMDILQNWILCRAAEQPDAPEVAIWNSRVAAEFFGTTNTGQPRSHDRMAAVHATNNEATIRLAMRRLQQRGLVLFSRRMQNHRLCWGIRLTPAGWAAARELARTGE